MLERLRPFVPPGIWPYGQHLLTLSQYLRNDFFRDLKRNRELAGKYAGQRAFVVGNGTSLSQLDLRKLAGEHIVTVNSFFRYEKKYGLTSRAHLFIDPAYFGPLEPELAEFAAAKDPSTLCFTPLGDRALVRRHLPDAYFLLMSGNMDVNTNDDISRPIAGVQTVALAALIVALYLGFSPIYLIGCDLDFLSHVVSAKPLRIAQRYFYSEAAEVVDVQGFDYPSYIQAIWRMFDGYRQVRDNLAHGRPIFNAGAGGLLETFPRVAYDSLFV